MDEVAATVAYEEPPVEAALGSAGKGVWGRLQSLNSSYPDVELAGTSVTFGRAHSVCSVAFDVPLVSSRHAVLHREGSLAFVEDLSSNGTFLNGEKIGKRKKRLLNQGDTLTFLLAQKGNSPIAYVYTEVSQAASDDEDALIRETYDLGQELGRGAFAVVYLAFNKNTQEKYAVKKINKKKFLQAQKRQGALMDEVNVLGSLDHPNVISVHQSVETDDHLYMVMELISGGELFDLIVDKGKLTEDEARPIFKQLLEALAYLHDHNIIHRDIKPENILVSTEAGAEHPIIKLVDFGLSRATTNSARARTLCGTPAYLAPEMLRKRPDETYTSAVDVYSAGVLLYVMISGMLPFDDELEAFSLYDQIKMALYSFPESAFGAISEAAKDLIRRLMVGEPSVRWTARQALEHPWILGQTLETTPIPITDHHRGTGEGPRTVKKFKGRATMGVMVRAAISQLAESNGSTPEDILATILEEFDVSHRKPSLEDITSQLVVLTGKDEVVQARGGKYKLSGGAGSGAGGAGGRKKRSRRR